MTGRGQLTGWLLDFHDTFFTEHVGLWITGILGLGLCALGISGPWLYRRFWR